MSKFNVELYGGPLDGFEGYREIIDEPGKFPLLVEPKGKKRYVYQARCHAEDRDDKPLVMDFVQIFNARDEL